MNLIFLREGHCCSIYIENIITFHAWEGFVVVVDRYFKDFITTLELISFDVAYGIVCVIFAFSVIQVSCFWHTAKTSGGLFSWDVLKGVTVTLEPEEKGRDLMEGCWSLQSSVYVAKNDTWNLGLEVSSELAQLSDDRQLYTVYK